MTVLFHCNLVLKKKYFTTKQIQKDFNVCCEFFSSEHLFVDLVSLPGGCMGCFPDLSGQNSQQLRVPEMGPQMPA